MHRRDFSIDQYANIRGTCLIEYAVWAAVASAIEVRMAELGLNHRELAERAGVALSTVRELRHNTVQRRRSGRTLEALSVALGLHPRHLSNLLVRTHPLATADTAPTD